MSGWSVGGEDKGVEGGPSGGIELEREVGRGGFGRWAFFGLGGFVLGRGRWGCSCEEWFLREASLTPVLIWILRGTELLHVSRATSTACHHFLDCQKPTFESMGRAGKSLKEKHRRTTYTLRWTICCNKQVKSRMSHNGSYFGSGSVHGSRNFSTWSSLDVRYVLFRRVLHYSVLFL